MIDQLKSLKRYVPSRLFAGDRVLWVIVALLAAISVLVVYSSTAKMAYDPSSGSSTADFLGAQLVYLVIAFVVILIVHHVNSHIFRNLALFLYLLGLILTVGALLFGPSTNGAARWLVIMGFQFQPSEMLKVMTLVLLAKQLGKRQKIISEVSIMPKFKFKSKTLWGQICEFWQSGFVQILAPVLVACVIILPAHTSSAALLFISSWVMFMIARVSNRELAKLVAAALLAFVLYLAIGAGRSDTAGGRFSMWKEQWFSNRTEIPIEELGDTERAMIAIHNGGLVGVGAGRSAMRVEMIHPESDYAFALFVEEYGLFMSLALLLMYLCVFFRSIEIFRVCGSYFSSLLVLGLGMMITLQALLHIAVTINLMPETGQTLPIISRGGSAMIFNALAFAMILSVSRQNEEHSHTTV